MPKHRVEVVLPCVLMLGCIGASLAVGATPKKKPRRPKKPPTPLSLSRRAYGVLANEHLMFPIDQVGFVYESMWIGFMRVMHSRKVSYKQTTAELTCSRDGRHWTRVGKREEFIALGGPKDWDAHYHDPAAEPILIGDELWIYYRSTRSGKARDKQKHYIGLAKLRRDGFVSLNAGEKTGTVVTRPLTFEGRHLFVNAEVARSGYLKTALWTTSGPSPAEHALSQCKPVTGDVMAARVAWKGGSEIEHRKGEPLRVVFEMKDAKLYSFWVQ